MVIPFPVLLPLLIGIAQSWPLDDTFSIWIWRSSVVVGQYLYIDGGEWYAKQKDGSPKMEELSSTYAIDLYTSWTTDTVNALTNSRPELMSTVRRPSLWYDPKSNYVYEWGGWPYDANQNNWLWSFQPDGRGGAAWTQNPAPASQGQPLNAPFGASWVSTPTAFYSVSGTLIPEYYYDPNTTIQGLVSYNFSSNIWSNTSSAGVSDSGYQVFGEGRYVSNFGPEGLLVFFGGSTPPNEKYGYNKGATLASLEKISIYDLQSDKWYHQNTTGDVPPVRSNFCSVGIAAPDNSSYEIFIYGGYPYPTGDEKIADEDYEDVFILSLPAFTWFRAPGTSAMREWHYCDLIGKRQMIVIGGGEPTAALGAKPDPWTRGLGIFDITELSWSNSYNASAQPYEQPSIIKQFYSTNPAQPDVWNDLALAAVFATNTTTTDAPNPSPSTNGEGTKSEGGNGPVPGTSTPHNKNVGAIAGGAIGGFIACIIVGLALYSIWRKHRRQPFNQRPIVSELDKTVPAQEMPNNEGYKPMHQLGPAERWELDETGRSVATKYQISDQ